MPDSDQDYCVDCGEPSVVEITEDVIQRDLEAGHISLHDVADSLESVGTRFCLSCGVIQP